MAPAVPDPSELRAVLELVHAEALRYLDTLTNRPLCAPDVAAAAASFRGALPETGVGALAALRELVERGTPATVATSGPRCFHLVIGGATPAAVAADWWTSAIDQIAASAVLSPLGVELEQIVLGWLGELFGLHPEMRGVLTTGATMANFTCLAAARQWCGRRHGVDVAEQGVAACPPIPVFSSGYLHASSVKALAMLGIGRAAVRRLAADHTGRLDLDALAVALAALDGGPAIVVANAGEVNAGAFDPIVDMAELAARHGAWLHVDGAFGSFAAASPATRHLVAGVEHASSVTADGHKWLNVPYDCGFAFVREPRLLAETFRLVADYLPGPHGGGAVPSNLTPESSRRARAFAVWAALRAQGRAGYRALVERHVGLAQHLAARVDAAPDLQRMADVPLNIVCFRYRPPGRTTAAELDRINLRIGADVLADGRVYVGTSRRGGCVVLRPAIVNWRTSEADVDLLVDVVRELGARAAAHGS